MKLKTLKITTGAFILFTGATVSCVSDPNSPGLEYMPDMYRSPSVEAYVDYAEVRGLFRPELVTETVGFIPPAGTIPYYGTGENVSYMMPYRLGAPGAADGTHGLYGVRQDTAAYRLSALDKNPIPFSEEVLNEGKALYGIYCIHCHGETGGGDGSVVLNSGGKFPPPPAYNAGLKDLPEGTIFYSITYGKNAMGQHASLLNKEERWKVVYYVQTLQGKTLGAATDTTNATAVTGGEVPAADPHAGNNE